MHTPRPRPSRAALVIVLGVLGLAPGVRAQLHPAGPDALPLEGPASFSISAVRTADVDDDGRPDLVALRGGEILVRFNRGGGVFSEPVATPGVPTGAIRFFEMQDLDFDGFPEAVVATFSPGQVQIWTNAMGGSAPPAPFVPGQAIALDGIPAGMDFVVLGSEGPDILITETHNGTGRLLIIEEQTFITTSYAITATLHSVSGFNAGRVRVEDVTTSINSPVATTSKDIVLTYQGAGSDRLYVLEANPGGLFGNTFSFTEIFMRNLTASSASAEIELADVTGDGFRDCVTHGSDKLVVYTNDGTGALGGTITSTLIGATGVSGVAAADFDRDGELDVLLTDSSGSVDPTVFRNLGGGTGFARVPIPAPGLVNPCCPDTEDLDGDGTPDAVFTALGGTPSAAVVYFGVEPVDHRKVMVSEVAPGNAAFVEVTNHGSSSADLSAWTLRWRDGTTTTSAALGVVLAAGESVVVGGPGSASTLGVPPPLQVVEAFPAPITSAGSDFTVALVDGGGQVVDEVRVPTVSGSHSEGSLGGLFRGLATRSSALLTGSLERIWGLDTNSGRDWTEQPVASPGFENRSSGPRGTDVLPQATVLINETDDSPDLVELHNTGADPVILNGWTLWCSAQQSSPHTIVRPFDSGTFALAPGAFLVIGEVPSAPPEMPGGVTYVDVSQNIPWFGDEYDCVLYDRYGRVVDAVRTTGDDDAVTHNHPRAPAHWADFRGAAGRWDGGGDDAVGRLPNGPDTDQGSDFQPVFVRTMGSTNLITTFASFDAGHGSEIDYRINDHALHGGLSIIVNCGLSHAFHKASIFPSYVRTNGQGPFYGLGPDALNLWLGLNNVPPYGGLLDADGSSAFHLPPGLLPPGLITDVIVLLQNPSGGFVSRTLVLEYDAF